MVVVGIDPGLHGGIVALRGDDVLHRWSADDPVAPYVLRSNVIPSIVREYLMLARVQAQATGEVFRVVVEEQQTRPMEGRVGAFNCGKNWGRILGVCHDIPVIEVSPAVWSRAILGSPPAGGWHGAGKKDAAIALVRTRLPALSLQNGRSKKPHDGLADAACLAMWGQSQ